MTTGTKPYTREEISAAFTRSEKNIKTGKLKNDPESRAFIERVIVQFILVRQLEPTEASFDLAFKELAPSLPWAVKPAKLLLQEGQGKPAKAESVQVSEGKFVDKVRAGEKADAYAKEQAQFEKSALELVAGFMPIIRGRINYRKKDEVQTHLNQHIAREKARGCSMKLVHGLIVEAIKKEYDAIEKASERP
jgi:hypothetical protein